MIDIVYLYTAGSNTDEIRFSLRSLHKHLHGTGRVYIVGDDPGIFKDVTIITAGNVHKHNKARNIYERILLACKRPDITGHFIYCSDDIFLLRDYTASKFPYYYCGQLADTLRSVSAESDYRPYLASTFTALMERSLPTINFNGHAPIVYEKEIYQKVMDEYDWEVKKGYISKSVYANTLKIGGDYLKDCKFHTPKTKTAILRKIKDVPIFSSDKYSFNQPMKEVLSDFFPTPSPYEK